MGHLPHAHGGTPVIRSSHEVKEPTLRTTTPQQSAALAESETALPEDAAEQFCGYAVMGVPFSSGHCLAFRRFPASSVGPGYHAVWLRTPDGQWSIHADAPPEVSCARYFGTALHETRQSTVSAEWTSPWELAVSVPGVVRWELGMKATWTTAAATAVARHMPRRCGDGTACCPPWAG